MKLLFTDEDRAEVISLLNNHSVMAAKNYLVQLQIDNALKDLELEVNSMEKLKEKACLTEQGIIVLEEMKKSLQTMKQNGGNK